MATQKLQVARAAAVVPSNTETIPSVSGGTNNGCVLYVGSTGNLRVQTAGGDDVTFVGLNAGSFIPVQVIQVFASGTSCVNIIALW
jgi:hypothetical protein